MRHLLVTFDVEEIDWGKPRSVTRWDANAPSAEGVERLVPVLNELRVRATFFVTASFARARPSLVRSLAASGHEVASHGLDHRDDYGHMPSGMAVGRLEESRRILEDLTGLAVRGVRTPRLAPCPPSTVAAAGFAYDASPQPTWVRGGLRGMRMPRRPWRDAGITLVPLSVVPVVRLPAAWYVLRLAGSQATSVLARLAGTGTPWIHLYLHPWEGAELRQWLHPHVLALGTGQQWIARLSRVVRSLARDLPAVTVKAALDAWLGDPPEASGRDVRCRVRRS